MDTEDKRGSDENRTNTPERTNRRIGGRKPPAPPVVLSEFERAAVDRLLFSLDDANRGSAVEALTQLTGDDCEHVGQYLIQQLDQQPDAVLRSWMVTAIAGMRPEGALEAIVRRLEARVEDDSLVRFWAVVRTAQLAPVDLNSRLGTVVRLEKDAQVVAVALRLLMEVAFDESYFQHWQKMAEAEDWYSRFAAAKVLRMKYGLRSLSSLETRFLPVLKGRMDDRSETLDVKFQAVLALGDFQQQWSAAIEALEDLLSNRPQDWLRRAAVDALVMLGKPETRDPLLQALLDTDAEIRVRSAVGLKKALGSAQAIDFIIERIMRDETPAPEYIDALRLIDNKAAADALSNRLLNPDIAVSNKAQSLLTQLGGEGALRSLIAQRNKAVDAYAAILSDTDRRIMEQFNILMDEARVAFKTNLWLHRIIFGIGALLLIASLTVALINGLSTLQGWIGVGGSAGSLATLLLLFYRNPVQNIDQSVSQLVKVDVIFLGYIRQINQIDATFKQLFLSTMSFGTDQMKMTVTEIRDSVNQTMQEIKENLGEK
jgi:HEAT repeat protein